MGIWTVFALIWWIRIYFSFPLGDEFVSSCPGAPLSAQQLCQCCCAFSWCMSHCQPLTQSFPLWHLEKQERGEGRKRGKGGISVLLSELKLKLCFSQRTVIPPPTVSFQNFCSSKDVLPLSFTSEMEETIMTKVKPKLIDFHKYFALFTELAFQAVSPNHLIKMVMAGFVSKSWTRFYFTQHSGV